MTESKSAVAARIALGLIFAVFGLNGFLGFLPMSPPEGEAGAFLGALAQTGYMFPLIKGTELIAGVLLLFGRAPAFALLLLAPIVVNIVLYHAILAPAGLLLGLLTLALGAYLAWQYWPRFSAIFKSPERQPRARTTEASVNG